MSLSEKAAQLNALSESSEIASCHAALAEAVSQLEQVASAARNIIGDLPASGEVVAVIEQCKEAVSAADQYVGTVSGALAEIAQRVRSAGAS